MLERRQYTYHELEEMLRNGMIENNVDTFRGIDFFGNNDFYYYSDGELMKLYENADINNGEPVRVLDIYSGADLLKITFTPINIVASQLNNCTYDSAYNRALSNVKEDFGKQYVKLLLEVEGSQGAMNDLDVAFEELNIIENVLQGLGMDIRDADTYKTLLNKVYEDYKNEE